MDELERIESRVAVLRSEIEERTTEIAELEIAAKVIRRLRTPAAAAPRKARWKPVTEPVFATDGTVPPVNNDLSGATVLAAATAVLRDNGGPLHFREIADAAMARGYTSPRDSSPERVRKTFWAIMQRNESTFEKAGNGRYQLKAA